MPLNRAKMVVINFTTSPDKPMENLLKITEIINQKLPEEAQMVFGVNTSKDLKEKMKIWLVATGI
ncbi:hypothetical protein [Campylobacter majalis]|uniref:hypothetical protein n=1 Tax=Campylobacter majalis TaxID=2790656 RepID=UPI003D691921